jgi:hypothetical protein
VVEEKSATAEPPPAGEELANAPIPGQGMFAHRSSHLALTAALMQQELASAHGPRAR